MAQTIFAINNVAVFELIPKESTRNVISKEEIYHLTDELKKQAVTALPKDEYAVLTKSNSAYPIGVEKAECLAAGCAVEIGKEVTAEYISYGTIGKFGKKFTISIELYETASGKLLSSVVSESEDIDGLLNAIRNDAKAMFQSILGSYIVPIAEAPKPAPAAPSGISASCVEEFVDVSKSGSFNAAKFIMELPIAAAKVKLQMKSPFGKPNDNEKTSVGVTVGCLNALPESPAEIKTLVKDLVVYMSFRTGKEFAAEQDDGEKDEDDKKNKEHKIRFGIRVAHNYIDSQQRNGSGATIGGISNFSLFNTMAINTELNFVSYYYYYNYSRDHDHEYAIDISVLLHICPLGGPYFYLESGPQLHLSFWNGLTTELANGFGWNMGKHFALGFRGIGLRTFSRIESGLSYIF
jgi:TolB-like protein